MTARLIALATLAALLAGCTAVPDLRDVVGASARSWCRQHPDRCDSRPVAP